MLTSLVLGSFLLFSADVPVLPQAKPSVIVKGELRYEVTRDLAGKITKLIVNRVDGKPMTHCAQWYAIHEFEFYCPGGPSCNSYSNLAYGTAYGSTESEACQGARADACSTISCGSSVTVCNVLTDWLGILTAESGGNCYYGFHDFCYGSGC
jgi:hypothetical protein